MLSSRPAYSLSACFAALTAAAAVLAWRESGPAAAILHGALLAAAGVSTAFWWRSRGARLEAETAAREDRIRALEENRRRVDELQHELTRTREASDAAESRFRSAFEQVAVGMNHVALDGRFLRVNQRYCAITGYTPEDLLRLKTFEITHPDDQEADRRHIDLLLRGDCETASWEKRYIRKDGSLIWVNLTASVMRSTSGSPLYFIGVVEDVTARVHAQEALRQSEQRFRQLVEHAPFGIFVEAGLEFRYLNRTASALFGAATPQQLIGSPVLDRIHPEDRAMVRERSRNIASGAPVPQAQRRFLRLDGDPFPAEVFPAAIVYDRQPASLVLLRDRSEEERMEQERLRLEQRLHHAQKMESIGRLAGGVAHDFNNHLTVINGYCDMLLDELSTDDPLCEEVGEIRAAATRAAALTEQLLAFSRKQIIELRPLNLNRIVEEHCRILGRLLGDQIDVITDLAPDLGGIEADQGRMHQVLMNLAINARDAMPRGGKLIFQTANADITPQPGRRTALPTAEDVPPGPYVVLSVSDTGTGMSPEIIAKIFEPFFTTKPMGSGTGLGLSTVYGFVEHAGGFIRVTSQLGAGSTFRIYLPRTGAVPEPMATAPDRTPLPNGTETILLVEDQADVRKLARGLLRKHGYNLIEAPDGPSALEAAQRHDGPIHLLLTDVIMPGMTGRELAERMHRARPRMKVLYMSGYSNEVFAHHAGAGPASGYLRKPFAPSELVAKIREVLGDPNRRPCVLVIDDDSAVRGYLSQILRSAGYEVLAAADGDEGLIHVEREDVHLVITDLVMPQREGLETVKALRSRFPEVRIIAVSGAFDGEFLKAASLLGADATFPKPIDPERLLPAVRTLIG